MQLKEGAIYFPNLNGLRFIAAGMVIVHHIEQIKSLFYLDSYWDKIPFVNLIGKLGVYLFFVLSGFLITYLLLSEERKTRTINIKKFYIRRILRIWPLYFLIIFLAIVILPNINIFILPDYGKDVIYSNLYLKIFLYVILFPNLVLTMLGMVPFASHTWSIGTEEQFYIIWPVLFKRIKKYRLSLMILIVFFYFFMGEFLMSDFSKHIPFKDIIQPYWGTFRIDCMAIGGFFGIVLFQKNRLLKVFLNTTFFYITIVSTILFMALDIYLHTIIYSILFGILILNFSSNRELKISLENSTLNYLGKISYGLYMFHPIGIFLALHIAQLMHFTTNWILYPFSFIITIIIATLSYRYFESIFLKFKSRFSK
jgi:peptidoglycan/LPS O-acetylase OafA/YrhL